MRLERLRDAVTRRSVVVGFSVLLLGGSACWLGHVIGRPRASADRPAAEVQKEIRRHLRKRAAGHDFALTREPGWREDTDRFRAEVRRHVDEAQDYQAIYRQIGRALWAADRLLSSQDTNQLRVGVALGIEASVYANQNAEDPWLAARIAEGYVLPNALLCGGEKRRHPTPDDAFLHCRTVFDNAEEFSCLVKAARLGFEYARGREAYKADAYHVHLAYALERAGDYPEAIRCYREMTNAIRLQYAASRIAWLEQQLARPPVKPRE